MKLPSGLCLTWLALSISCASAAEDRPNIILMMADDLGWGDVGFNGNTIIKTPHLDELADAGLKFNRFYAAAPVCSPTRGSCLTGRHPYRYGIFSANVGHMRAGELTLAELLTEHGYASGHFGKWHLGTLTKEIADANRGGPRGAAHYSPPWENGFDTCFSTESKVPTWDPMLRPKSAKGNTWWDPVDDAADATAYGTHYWTNGNLARENLRGDDSRAIMDRAIPFIRAASQDKKPFFAVIWFHAPHLPVVAGPKYTAIYAERDKHSQHYFGSITALDEQVGRLWAELGELGVRENTLITFCSDNGPEGGDGDPGRTGGLRGRKRSLFEGGVRVPGLAVWPAKIKAGSVTDVPACTSDYLPTIVDILGVKPMKDERELDGISLTPLFSGEMEHRPKAIGFQSDGQASLVDNHWKLIRVGQRKKKAATMLFDLKSDRAEAKDVAADHPDRVEKMTAALVAWQASCASSLQKHNGQSWPRHAIDDTSRGADGVRLADFNGDGRADIATGWEQGGLVRLYLHPGAEKAKQSWPQVTVGHVKSAEDAVPVDLDGDGAMDIVTCCEGHTRTIYVHWSPHDKAKLLDAEAWTTEPFPQTAGRRLWMFALPIQVDGARGVDLVVGSKGKPGGVAALVSPDDPRDLKSWKMHDFAEMGWIMSLQAHDCDGDKNLDVLISNRKSPRRGVFWLRNPASKVSVPREPLGGWKLQRISADDREVMFLARGDVTADGRADVVVAVRGRGLSLLEGPASPANQDKEIDLWPQREIALPKDIGTGKGVAIGDVDLDGRADIVFSCENASGKKSGVRWLSGDEKTDGWNDHEISGPEGIKFDRLELLDLDSDGDLDVLTCEERAGLGVIWYENPAR